MMVFFCTSFFGLFVLFSCGTFWNYKSSISSKCNKKIIGIELISISHLLFADNTMIFCGANLDHLCNLHCLFLCFEAISGLRINLAKLELVPIGNVNNVEGLANILGCTVSSLPLKYLGLPLGDLF